MNESNGNNGVRVRFWEDAYKNATKSLEAGRPVFDTVDWCEIQALGETDTIVGPVHRLQPDPRERFRAAWTQYQRDKSSEGLVGTPLKEVPWLERGDVETLVHSGIKTLEHLSQVSDGNIGGIPGGIALRQKARDTIKMAKESAPLQAMSDELAKRDAQIEALKVQIADILAAKRKGKNGSQE